MDNVYAIATAISIVFFVIKYVQIRMVNKESEPVSAIAKDSLVVFVSCVVGFFVLDQAGTAITQTAKKGGSSPAFTDNPTF